MALYDKVWSARPKGEIFSNRQHFALYEGSQRRGEGMQLPYCLRYCLRYALADNGVWNPLFYDETTSHIKLAPPIVVL